MLRPICNGYTGAFLTPPSLKTQPQSTSPQFRIKWVFSSQYPVRLWVVSIIQQRQDHGRNTTHREMSRFVAAYRPLFCCCYCSCIAPRVQLLKISAWLLHTNWWQGSTCRTLWWWGCTRIKSKLLSSHGKYPLKWKLKHWAGRTMVLCKLTEIGHTFIQSTLLSLK